MKHWSQLGTDNLQKVLFWARLASKNNINMLFPEQSTALYWLYSNTNVTGLFTSSAEIVSVSSFYPKVCTCTAKVSRIAFLFQTRCLEVIKPWLRNDFNVVCSKYNLMFETTVNTKPPLGPSGETGTVLGHNAINAGVIWKHGCNPRNMRTKYEYCTMPR